MRPAQRERVKVTDKRWGIEWGNEGPDSLRYFFTFEFPDGSSKETSEWVALPTRLSNETAAITDVNDTGLLLYAERGKKIKLIGFERDNHTEETKLSLYDKLYNTKLSSAFYLFFAAFWGIGLARVMILFNSPQAGLLFSLITAAIAMCFYSPSIYAYYKLKYMPEKKEKAKVLDAGEFSKRNCADQRIFVFEFPGGSRKCFMIPSKYGKALPVIDDTGTLIYKELGNQVSFVGFEKD